MTDRQTDEAWFLLYRHLCPYSLYVFYLLSNLGESRHVFICAKNTLQQNIYCNIFKAS